MHRFPMLAGIAIAAALPLGAARAQPMTLAEVTAAGAVPLTAQEARQLVTGARTEFTPVAGALRIWTHEGDGSFIASRSNFADVRRRSARGTWSVDDAGVYCLAFDWGGKDTDGWCRRLYKVEDRYYAFGVDAKPEARSGVYRFSR